MKPETGVPECCQIVTNNNKAVIRPSLMPWRISAANYHTKHCRPRIDTGKKQGGSHRKVSEYRNHQHARRKCVILLIPHLFAFCFSISIIFFCSILLCRSLVNMMLLFG
ncbi:hypothetical protein IHE45_20G004100 [Dioscorea alata]|uniref:Uncharacterized protein n=1 Tax=Dioscorea alata TaxID=55571 RepID=A0ACB7TUC2_DIOAL|nr:hypothetical protein IHE45_20G004100 [Dioscorea alata]